MTTDNIMLDMDYNSTVHVIDSPMLSNDSPTTTQRRKSHSRQARIAKNEATATALACKQCRSKKVKVFTSESYNELPGENYN